ncbi:MAG: phasin family protein [Aestuariivirga sp.]|uniref:phasin family protein n=1 Tax=Aestuariivirga sp. TaxID=2650926 RepID=UPI0038CFA5C5
MPMKKAKAQMNSAKAEKVTGQVADQVANFAQKTVDDAQAAFEKASELAHGNVQMMDAAANACKNRMTDIQLKAMEFAQANVNSGFAFVRKCFSLSDPAAAMALHQDFFKAQAEAMQRQAGELNELSVALAKESLKPVQETFTKSFASLSKSIAA